MLVKIKSLNKIIETYKSYGYSFLNGSTNEMVNELMSSAISLDELEEELSNKFFEAEEVEHLGGWGDEVFTNCKWYHLYEVNDLKHEGEEFTRDNRIPSALFSALKEKLDKILAE